MRLTAAIRSARSSGRRARISTRHPSRSVSIAEYSLTFGTSRTPTVQIGQVNYLKCTANCRSWTQTQTYLALRRIAGLPTDPAVSSLLSQAKPATWPRRPWEDGLRRAGRGFQTAAKGSNPTAGCGISGSSGFRRGWCPTPDESSRAAGQAKEACSPPKRSASGAKM